MDTKIYEIKNYTNYTETEIMNLLKLARNRYQYDSIIDRLYFKDDTSVKKWIPKALNIKSARRLAEIESSEMHGDLIQDMATANDFLKKNPA